ncbi:hypothetical protein LCGC14_2640840 [marine sediment metagenome]|uniref:Uncharacterized protein n=1 Tax=marine sediment metagenome TaxID=412755 RepID=A0A0F9CPT8_9ZZZZ
MKVPCLACEHLEISREKDGLWFSCGLGLYDTEGVKQYYAISGMTTGNVRLWKVIGYPYIKCSYKQVV